MKTDDNKLKFIPIAVLSALLIAAMIFAFSAARDYYAAVEALKARENEASQTHSDDIAEEDPIRFYDDGENTHVVSDEQVFAFFDDAVFVGDSRTEGLFLYSQIAEKTKAVAYAWRGFTTQDILDNKKFTVDGKSVSGVEALKQNKNFSKVYIMLGVNELAKGGAEDFIKRYDQIVSAALETNPDARIVVQSIIPVTAWKSAQSSYVNNTNAAEYNAALFEYARDKGYIWLDVAALFSDDEGNLKSQYDSGDGIHLTTAACDIWFEYLCYYTYL